MANDEDMKDPLQALADAVLAKIDVSSSSPENLVLAHLRALRREILALSEGQALLFKHVTRQGAQLDELSAKVGREFRATKLDIGALEMNDISRHGELLQVLRKL